MVEVFELVEIGTIAKKIIQQSTHKVFLFEGGLGFGKTTLIKALCVQWGVIDTVNSPTFSLINEYKTKDQSIYHFDCYRLESVEEALDIGTEEYLDSGMVCLIEWPEKIEPLINSQHHRIKLEYINEHKRKISFK